MKSLLKVLSAGAVVVGLCSVSLAQTTTFANFSQDVGADKSFKFTNAGGFVTENTVTLSNVIPVNFTFLIPTNDNSITPGTPIMADLTITSVTNGPANIGVVNASQRLSGVQMTFTGTGAYAGQNLLTIFSSTGTLSGTLNGSTAGVSETDNGSTQIVQYSSDFLDFSTSTQRNYSLSLNNVTPNFSASGGVINDFTSNATGQFASNGFVPEPGTLGLVSIGLLGLTLGRRRNKNIAPS